MSSKMLILTSNTLILSMQHTFIAQNGAIIAVITLFSLTWILGLIALFYDDIIKKIASERIGF